MNIRLMKKEDLAGVYEVEIESFASPWSYESLERDLMENKCSIYVVAEDNKKIVGYIGSWLIMDEGQIINIAVKDSHRGKGIGFLLMKFMIDRLEKEGCNSIFLDVRVGNTSAINLYKKFNFEVVGKRPKYYSGNDGDAYIMLRK